MLKKGYSQRAISKALDRSPNTISYEIKPNKVNGVYDPKKAGHKAYVRRLYAHYQGKKILENKELKRLVHKLLYADQSPEAIAGRLRYQEKDLPNLSKDSIYRYIKSIYGRRIEYYRSKKKQRKKGRRKRVTQLTDRRPIDKRPKVVATRKRVGDVEADFVVSGRNGRGILLVIVCRKLRVTFIRRILRATITNVHKAFLDIQRHFPEMRTITTDNDILLQKHKELEGLLCLKIYFCDPYSSWQKGSVENTNKHIRKDIPKGSNISKCSPSFIKRLEGKINNRILKCLNYQTPAEILQKHRKRKSASRRPKTSKP